MECRTSKAKVLGLLGLTCVMVALCWFVTRLPDPVGRVVGWIGVGFFGLGFVAMPIAFFRRGPQVIIDDRGIEDRRMNIGPILWEDIQALSIVSVSSAKMLSIELADPEKYLSRLPRRSRWLVPVNRAFDLPALTIGFSDLTPGLKEVWAHLEARGLWSGGNRG